MNPVAMNPVAIKTSGNENQWQLKSVAMKISGCALG